MEEQQRDRAEKIKAFLVKAAAYRRIGGIVEVEVGDVDIARRAREAARAYDDGAAQLLGEHAVEVARAHQLPDVAERILLQLPPPSDVSRLPQAVSEALTAWWTVRATCPRHVVAV